MGVPKCALLIALKEVRLAPSPGIVDDCTELTWLDTSRGAIVSDGFKLLGLRSPIIIGDWSKSLNFYFPPSSLKACAWLGMSGRAYTPLGAEPDVLFSEPLRMLLGMGFLLSFSAILGFWAAQQFPILVLMESQDEEVLSQVTLYLNNIFKISS